jgi:hypothetical protein
MMLQTQPPHTPEWKCRWLIPSIAAFCMAVTAGFAQTESPAEPRLSEKRVVVDKTQQMLFAYEGERVVIQSRVSTGRAGWRTPSGNFSVGIKDRMHYSRLFDNAPMPWSVQVNGHYFIHGFSYVPDFPASHGCVRLPTNGDNPAKRFFEWVEPGTPVTITGDWIPIPKARVIKRPTAK